MKVVLVISFEWDVLQIENPGAIPNVGDKVYHRGYTRIITGVTHSFDSDHCSQTITFTTEYAND